MMVLYVKLIINRFDKYNVPLLGRVLHKIEQDDLLEEIHVAFMA